MNLNEILPVSVGNLILLGLLISAVGKLLKEVPKFPNHFIPLTLSVLGGGAMAWMEGFTPAAVIVGIGTGAGTVGLHQLVTQITDARDAGKLKEKDPEPPKTEEPVKPPVVP